MGLKTGEESQVSEDLVNGVDFDRERKIPSGSDDSNSDWDEEEAEEQPSTSTQPHERPREEEGCGDGSGQFQTHNPLQPDSPACHSSHGKFANTGGQELNSSHHCHWNMPSCRRHSPSRMFSRTIPSGSEDSDSEGSYYDYSDWEWEPDDGDKNEEEEGQKGKAKKQPSTPTQPRKRPRTEEGCVGPKEGCVGPKEGCGGPKEGCGGPKDGCGGPKEGCGGPKEGCGRTEGTEEGCGGTKEGCDKDSGVGRGKGKTKIRAEGLWRRRVQGHGRAKAKEGGGATPGGATPGEATPGEAGQEKECRTWLGIDVKDIVPPEPVFRPRRRPGPQLLPGAKYSILDLFHQFIPSTMLLEIVRNSNRYGQRTHPREWKKITLGDLYSYIGMVIFMGVVKVKQLRDYWKKSEIYNLSFPPTLITGRKFNMISLCLHLSSMEADEANDKVRSTSEFNRLCKIEPMYSQLREVCRANFHPQQNISIDERMVKSKARTSLRQYMKDKPTKWGYKLFVIADAETGYTWDFFIYEGKGKPVLKGLSYDSVMQLVDVKLLGQGYKLYVDNFYTSPALFLDLLDSGIWACGTIRRGRIGFRGGLEDDKRSPRGTIRWIREGPLMFVGWRDTKDIYLCSTIHTAHGDHSVQRKMKTDGQWADRTISAPSAVVDYNAYMGGVDLSDAMISYYNTLHKTRKWYKTFFFHFLDIGIVNAFILHKELAKERQEVPLSQKKFREALIMELRAVSSASTAKQQARPPPAPDGAPHKPRYFTNLNKNRRRCVDCSAKVSTECTSCSVTLCFTVNRDCFNKWHDDHGL